MYIYNFQVFHGLAARLRPPSPLPRRTGGLSLGALGYGGFIARRRYRVDGDESSRRRAMKPPYPNAYANAPHGSTEYIQQKVQSIAIRMYGLLRGGCTSTQKAEYKVR